LILADFDLDQIRTARKEDWFRWKYSEIASERARQHLSVQYVTTLWARRYEPDAA
jgi:hypothetical protein